MSFKRYLAPLLAFALVFLTQAQAQDPVVLSSQTFGKYLDAHDFAQTFTTTAPVTLSRVDFFARKLNGGQDVTVTLCTYDAWNKVRLTDLATVTVPVASITTAGGWVAATFPAPVTLSTPGVHAIYLSIGTTGTGYNDFGLAYGDSIPGGRFVGPTSTSPTELLFRLRSPSSAANFVPADPPAPKVALTTTPIYIGAATGWKTQFQYKWRMVPGAAYLVYYSPNLVTWTYSSKRLGADEDTTYTTNNQYYNARYFKVQAIPLGDLEY